MRKSVSSRLAGEQADGVYLYCELVLRTAKSRQALWGSLTYTGQAVQLELKIV
jgi:hypothetical protein